MLNLQYFSPGARPGGLIFIGLENEFKLTVAKNGTSRYYWHIIWSKLTK